MDPQSLERRFNRFESNIQNIESRFSRIEDILLSLAGRQQPGDDNTATIRAAVAPDAPANDASLSTRGNPTLPTPTHSDDPSNQSRTQTHEPMSRLWPVIIQEDTVDGMGSIIFADEAKSGFFGPSSNSSFVSKVAKALASGSGPVRGGRDFSRDLEGKLSRPSSPPSLTKSATAGVDPYVLPPRGESSRLVEIFFSFTGRFFPYISRSMLTQVLGELDPSRLSGVRKSTLCLLNAVFAMATSLDRLSGRPAKQRDVESDIFFQRALVLSPWTISNTANLETLQALTVMTQYLQGSSRSAQTWKLHGLLVQAAFQLGVYTKDSNCKLSAFEQEIRTRIWFTCVILDRIFATTFGRPPLIHDELTHMDMPLDVELDSLPKDRSPYQALTDPNREPSSCIIFNPSIRLYCLQGEILSKVYNGNKTDSPGLPQGELFSRIIEIDYELESWKSTLHHSTSLIPLEFVEGMDPDNWVYSKVQTVLTLRFLSVRILLFRKALENTLDSITSVGGVLKPIDCSMPTITIICKLGPKAHLLPAWWYSAYYVFSSALIIFGIICVQTSGDTDVGTKPAAELLVCLQTSLGALDVIGKETRIVRRCSKYLRKMVQVSTLLVRNHVPPQQLGTDVSALINSLPVGHPPSTIDGSDQSPFQTEFGPFLVDEDYAFLDAWSDLNF
ncbi:hypothetical protein B0A52_01306 [Exophiala mesophila]|uniref:Xylanolytic transcriptional activator regulatory domain-containing protein n=1 Tax=Exophiala mesophila TaxID=212818 RepID=A0A438NH23_EXOME|nr:hypothetical protein B0A52_01306 [Exophiala mesophila]